MIKRIWTSIFFLAVNLIFGQINPTIKHIFLDLPLDKPRADIQKTIKSDKRFKSTDKDSSELINMYTYIGLSSDKGIIESQPDSIEIELSWGSGTFRNKKGKFKSIGMTFLKLRYFYSYRDSVDKEYKRVLNVLRPIHKDTLFSRIDTVYSDSPIRAQFKAYSMTFSNSKTNYSVEVYNASVTKNYFGLFIEYKRDEK